MNNEREAGFLFDGSLNWVPVQLFKQRFSHWWLVPDNYGDFVLRVRSYSSTRLPVRRQVVATPTNAVLASSF